MIMEMGSNQFQANLINDNLTLTVIEGPAHDTIIEIPKQPKITIDRKPNNLTFFNNIIVYSQSTNMTVWNDPDFYSCLIIKNVKTTIKISK